ncbi:MAG: hypothetical protein JOZ53_06730, partial [Planctomycetaceae bacterium]|nr:hypothetical protein [Planctomycetaceae bacterium]
SIPKGLFCNHKINYFQDAECRFPLELLLGLLNSKLLDWYFRLGSTNASVSHYQLYNLPIPFFAPCQPDDTSERFGSYLVSRRWADAFVFVEPLLAKPPFSAELMSCMIHLVEEIIRIEAARGDIARTERSALDPQAQPYQDLLDKIHFRLAGLTDEEAAGLVRRLKVMR